MHNKEKESAKSTKH